MRGPRSGHIALVILGIVAGLLGRAETAQANGCDSTVPITHTTIQAAVDAAPNPGPWKICVNDGTYVESVKILGRNTAAVDATETIRVVAVNPRGAIVNPGGLPNPARYHAFSVATSNFISIEGFKLTGATREAVFIRGGLSMTNRNISVIATEITGNGSPSTNGGIFIGRENPDTLVDGNTIHRNFRNALEIEGDIYKNPTNSPKVITNNLICKNGWSGVYSGRTFTDVITLLDNDIHCNGTATGSTGGRFGVFRQAVAPKSGAGFRQNIILDGNEICSNTGGDIANVNQTLGPLVNDTGNVTTLGNEEAQCLAPGCAGAITGTCLVTDCDVLCP